MREKSTATTTIPIEKQIWKEEEEKNHTTIACNPQSVFASLT